MATEGSEEEERATAISKGRLQAAASDGDIFATCGVFTLEE